MLITDFARHRFKPHFRVGFCSVRKAFYVRRYYTEHQPTLSTLFVGDFNPRTDCEGGMNSFKECIEWCERNTNQS